MRSLVIDDDKTSRLLLREILRDLGPTDVVDNGHDALITICNALENSTPYDLVCLDIMMPDLDGHSVLKEIRKVEKQLFGPLKKRTKILMVTAVSNQDNILRAYIDQCDDYIIKPISRQRIHEAISNLKLR